MQVKRLSPSKIGRLEFNLKYIALPIIVFVIPSYLNNWALLLNLYLFVILPYGVYGRAKDIFKKEPKHYLMLYYYFLLVYFFALFATPYYSRDYSFYTMSGLFLLTLTPYLLRASKKSENYKEDLKENNKKFAYLALFITAPILGSFVSLVGARFITFLAMFLKNILSH